MLDNGPLDYVLRVKIKEAISRANESQHITHKTLWIYKLIGKSS